MPTHVDARNNITQVLKDCERKHDRKESKYETLADAISERVRDAVGEHHWRQARRIQKQLALNQQKKKMKAMLAQRQRVWEQQQAQSHSHQHQSQEQDETMRPREANNGSSTQDDKSEESVSPTPSSTSSASGTEGTGGTTTGGESASIPSTWAELANRHASTGGGGGAARAVSESERERSSPRSPTREERAGRGQLPLRKRRLG